MKQALCFLLALFCALPAVAHPALSLKGAQAIYVGGTIPQLKIGDAGTLDLTNPAALQFLHGQATLQIPYATIQSWSQRKENAIPLGVAATIVVGIVAKRHKAHYVEITYRDIAGVSQVALFQIAKTMPPVLEPVLKARVPSPSPAHSARPVVK